MLFIFDLHPLFNDIDEINYLLSFESSNVQISFDQDSDPALTQAVVARLLGNTNVQDPGADTSKNTTNPNNGMVSSIPNPVLKFLNAREAPKVVNIKAGSDKNSSSNVDVRKMHHAGGYDVTSYEARNWSEIHMHIGCL